MYTPALAKHSKHFSMEDRLAVDYSREVGQNSRETRKMTGHSDSVRSVAVTPVGQRAVSASDHNTLKVWNLEYGR